MGSWAVRSSRQREDKILERFGPAGASTAQVTAADLRRSVSMMHRTKLGVLVYAQHICPFTLVDLADKTQFVISTGSLQKFSCIVADASLAELIRQKGFAVACGMDERGSTVMICFCLYGILFLKEQTDDANINPKLFFVGARSRSIRRLA